MRSSTVFVVRRSVRERVHVKIKYNSADNFDSTTVPVFGVRLYLVLPVGEAMSGTIVVIPSVASLMAYSIV